MTKSIRISPDLVWVWLLKNTLHNGRNPKGKPANETNETDDPLRPGQRKSFQGKSPSYQRSCHVNWTCFLYLPLKDLKRLHLSAKRRHWTPSLHLILHPTFASLHFILQPSILSFNPTIPPSSSLSPFASFRFHQRIKMKQFKPEILRSSLSLHLQQQDQTDPNVRLKMPK